MLHSDAGSPLPAGINSPPYSLFPAPCLFPLSLFCGLALGTEPVSPRGPRAPHALHMEPGRLHVVRITGDHISVRWPVTNAVRFPLFLPLPFLFGLRGSAWAVFVGPEPPR